MAWANNCKPQFYDIIFCIIENIILMNLIFDDLFFTENCTSKGMQRTISRTIGQTIF